MRSFRVPVLGFVSMIIGLAAPGPAPQASGATYHVSQSNPSAADNNPGTEARPWETLGRAAEAISAGDTVLIGTGVYREQLRVDRDGTAARPIRFEAAPAAHVVLTGADRITGWKRGRVADERAGQTNGDAEHIYAVDWPHSFLNFSPLHAHPDDEYHRLIGRVEQVFVFGYPLRQVLAKSELARGTFYVDLQAKRLYARAADDRDLSRDDALVEASVRDVVLDCRGAYVTIKGLHVRYAANAAQQGSAVFRGAHDVVEDCTFERTNGSGAAFVGPDQVARRCVFRENGQLGFGAAGAHRLLVTDCEIRDNNTKGFDRGWEAGGDKLVLCRGAVLDHCIFAGNRGNGVWFDIGNEDCEVRNGLIADNEDAGIFDEISYGLRARDNVIMGNGFAGTPGSWGAAAGICLSSSPGSVVERNLIVGNKEGFDFREQDRTTPRIDPPTSAPGGRTPEEPIWNHDEVIRNNLFAFNRDAQVWGWFDVKDARAWPRSVATSQPSEPAGAPADLAAPYRAKSPAGPQAATDLAALRLQFVDNVYAVAPGQGLFNWGVPWRRHATYTSLEGVRRELGLETGGLIAPLPFRDPAARDFRLAGQVPASVCRSYPQGDVPSVRMDRRRGPSIIPP